MRHIGSKVLHVAEHGLSGIKHLVHKVHEHARSIPVVGQALADGLQMAANLPIPGVGRSAKEMFRGAERAVGVGKMLTSEDETTRREGYHKILNGDVGSVAQRGAQAVQRIANAIT